MIVPVAPEHVEGRRPSFHPKFVLVRYAGNGKPRSIAWFA